MKEGQVRSGQGSWSGGWQELGEERWQDAKEGGEMRGGERERICFWDGQASEMLQWSHTAELWSKHSRQRHIPFLHISIPHLLPPTTFTSLINLHLTPHFNLLYPPSPFPSSSLHISLPPLISSFAPAGEWADFRTPLSGGGQVGWASLSFTFVCPLFLYPSRSIFSSFSSNRFLFFFNLVLVVFFNVAACLILFFCLLSSLCSFPFLLWVLYLQFVPVVCPFICLSMRNSNYTKVSRV